MNTFSPSPLSHSLLCIKEGICALVCTIQGLHRPDGRSHSVMSQWLNYIQSKLQLTIKGVSYQHTGEIKPWNALGVNYLSEKTFVGWFV